MGTPVNERVRQWRDRERAKGNREITVLLDKDTVERFDLLRSKFKTSNSELIGLALKSLEKEIGKKKKLEHRSYRKDITKKQKSARGKKEGRPQLPHHLL